MSTFPPPNSFDNSNFRYGGYALRDSMTGSDPYGDSSVMGGDPWANYGLNGYADSGVGSQNTALQQYSYDRQLALQTLQSGNLDPQTQQVWQNYLKELDRWFQTYGGSSPSAGGILGSSSGMGVAGLQSTSSSFQVSYQDSTRIQSEEGPADLTISRNDTDSRQIEFFQKDVSLNIPSYAASGTQQLADDDAVPGAKMLIQTVNFPNGTSRKIVVHNFDENSHLNINAADSSKFPVDASLGALSSQCTVSQGADGSGSQTQVQGDEPAKRHDGKLGWDGSEFNIFSRSDGKDKYVSARNGAHFHASSNTEYWTVEWDNANSRYVVRVYDNAQDAKASPPDAKKAKENFYVDDMTNLKATFDIDPSHIFFKGSLADASDPDGHKINTSGNPDSHGKKLSLDNGNGASTPGAGEALNPNYPKATGESVPHSTNGNNAYYDQDSKVQIHTYYDDGFDHHYITAQDSVDIFPFTQADEVTATYVPAGDSTGKIQLDYKYVDSSGAEKHEFYVIDPLVTSIDPHTTKISGEAAGDPKIKRGGVSNADYPDGLKTILSGKKDSEVLSALQAAGYKDYKTITDFAKAVSDGDFPPSPPDTNFIRFLAQVDVEYKADVSKAMMSQTFDEQAGKLQTAADRLNQLLGEIYPNHQISSVKGFSSPDGCGISFNFDKQFVSIDTSKSKNMAVSVSPPWPDLSDILGNVPKNDYWDWAEDMARLMIQGVQSGDFSGMRDYFKSHDNKGYLNDGLRELMTALYQSVGSDKSKLQGLLKSIPSDVRQSMINGLTTESDEQRDGEEWDTATTAAIIQETL